MNVYRPERLLAEGARRTDKPCPGKAVRCGKHIAPYLHIIDIPNRLSCPAPAPQMDILESSRPSVVLQARLYVGGAYRQH